MIITIDGPIATGKSTIAKNLAREIGFIYFDTGAMYRSLTYGLLKHQIDLHDPNALANYLKNFNFEIKVKHGERFYYVEGEDVTLKIRNEEVTSRVSEVSAIPAVREKLVALQRQLAIGVNAVFEGRDMGTTVFPNAQLKIYLTGRPEIRAKRRYEELRAKFPEEALNITLEKVLEDIKARDKNDTERELSPLKQAEDACVIDTSDLTLDEVVLKILEFKDTIRARMKPST